MLNSSTGQVESVPEEQVPALYAAGTHQLPAAPLHVVGQDGTVGTVDPSQAGALFASGGRLAKPEEVRAAKLDAKYGGIGGGLAALGEGAARGLTLGASDPLAVGAAGLFGGQKAAAATREHLANEKEANPLLSMGGEVAGAVAPLILSGGTSAPEQSASVTTAIADGVRTLGAAPRAVGGLGDLAEHAIANVLGEGSSVLGRAGQAAAKQAVRGIVEGGLFAGGAEISDATLENRPLTAEKLLSAVGHGALTAGLLGGALGGFGSLATDGAQAALGQLSPKLDEAANLQAARWAGVDDLHASRVGGAKAVGDTVLDEVLKPAIAEGGMAAAAMSPEAKLAAIEKATGRIGKQIGSLVEGTDATVSLDEMLRPIDERIEKMRGLVGHEGQVRALEGLKESVQRTLGSGEAVDAVDQLGAVNSRYLRDPETYRPASLAAERARYAGRTADEVDALAMNQRPIALHTEPDGSIILDDGRHRLMAANEAGAKRILAVVRQYDADGNVLAENIRPVSVRGAEGIDVPIANAIEQRRALQNIAFRESKSLDPNTRVQLLREVSTEWNNLEERAINEASEDHAMGTQLRALNRKFSQLKLAEAAAEKAVAKPTALMNPITFGLAAHSLANGNIPGAAGMVAASAARQALREHGNAYAALMLDRLSTWGGISKAVAETNEGIDAALGSAMGGKRPVGRPSSPKSSLGRYDEEAKRVRTLASVAPAVVAAHLQHATSSMQMHAPELQKALASQTSKATQYLASALPPSADPTSSLTPHLDEAHVSAEQKIQFLRKVDAVEGGPPAILKRLASGRMTPEDVDVLKKVYPNTLDEIRQKVAERCADRSKPVPYPLRIQLGTLLDVPTDATLEPQFIQAIRAGYAASAPKATPADATPKKGASKTLKSLDQSKGMVESAMSSGSEA